MRLFSVTILGLSLLGWAGCATEKGTIRYTGDPIKDGEYAIQNGPKRDRVLWEERTALNYMRQGQFADAKRLLDDALLMVGGIKTADKNSRQARSMFHSESKKIFVGEPYERVMAYYYRGILYWMDGEPDNARACFRSAQIQDSDTENKTYASDYALLDYLDGLASTKLLEDGSDAFKRAQKLAKSSLPPYNLKANVLVFVDFGRGPEKYATGKYAEELRFHEGVSLARRAVVSVDGQTIALGPYDDLYYQATTRGGRVMDHVLAGKAVFKTATGAVGIASLISGAALATSRDRTMREAGLGLLALGAVSEVVSAVTVPEADIRSWDNLPQFLTFTALSLPPGQHNARVEFQNAYGQTIPSMTKAVTINIPAGSRDCVLYINDQTVKF